MKAQDPLKDGSGLARSQATMEDDSRSTVYALSGFILGGDEKAMSKMQAEGELAADAAAPSVREKVGGTTTGAKQAKGNLVIHFAQETERAATDDPATVQCSLEQVNGLYHLTLYITTTLMASDTSSVHTRLATPDSLVVDLNGTLIGIGLPDEVSGLIVP